MFRVSWETFIKLFFDSEKIRTFWGFSAGALSAPVHPAQLRSRIARSAAAGRRQRVGAAPGRPAGVQGTPLRQEGKIPFRMTYLQVRRHSLSLPCVTAQAGFSCPSGNSPSGRWRGEAVTEGLTKPVQKAIPQSASLTAPFIQGSRGAPAPARRPRRLERRGDSRIARLSRHRIHGMKKVMGSAGYGTSHDG